MASELNPKHPTTFAMHDHWHKIAAILLHKFVGLEEFVVTEADIVALAGACGGKMPVVMIKDDADGLKLRIITEDEAHRLAKKERFRSS